MAGKKSYFILKSVKPHSKEKTDVYWTQDMIDFLSYCIKHETELAIQNVRLFWRNKETTLEKVLAKTSCKAWQEWESIPV